MTADTIGRRIARARRELAVRIDRDMSQGDLARELGVHYTVVYNWERDAKKPSAENMTMLSKTLGVTEAWLHYGAEPKALAGWVVPSTLTRPVVHGTRHQPAAKKRGKAKGG